MWTTTNWKIVREMGIPDHLTCLLRNLPAGQEAPVRTWEGTADWLRIGKGVDKVVYCYLVYLTLCRLRVPVLSCFIPVLLFPAPWTVAHQALSMGFPLPSSGDLPNPGIEPMYMQSTLCEMPGWTNHKLEQDFQEKYQQPQICRCHHPNVRKWRRAKEPFEQGERGEWKSWLTIQHSKTNIMVSGSITSWQIEEEKVEAVTDFTFLGSKITVDTECSHEIKRCLLLEGKVKTHLAY